MLPWTELSHHYEDSIARLLHTAMQEVDDLFPTPADGQLDSLRAGVQQIFTHDRNPRRPRLIAPRFLNGMRRRLIGLCLAVPHFDIFHWRSYYCVQGFYLLPQYRRHGEHQPDDSQVAGAIQALGRTDTRVLIGRGNVPAARAAAAAGFAVIDYELWVRALRNHESLAVRVQLELRSQVVHVRTRRGLLLTIQPATRRHLVFLREAFLVIANRVLKVHVSPEDMGDWIEQSIIFSDAFFGQLFVATLDNRVVACGKLQLEHALPGPGFVAYFRHPFVTDENTPELPQLREEGVCGALIEGALRLAAPPGTKELRIVIPRRWGTHADETRTRDALEHSGYRLIDSHEMLARRGI